MILYFEGLCASCVMANWIWMGVVVSVVWRRCSFSFVIVVPIPHKAQLLKLYAVTQDVCVCVCVCVCVKGWGVTERGLVWHLCGMC